MCKGLAFPVMTSILCSDPDLVQARGPEVIEMETVELADNSPLEEADRSGSPSLLPTYQYCYHVAVYALPTWPLTVPLRVLKS